MASTNVPQQRVKISCTRCQFRKLKCSRTDPCVNCANAGQDCEYRENAKRRPVSRVYVKGLEDRIAWLENLISRLQVASTDERDELLNKIDLGDHLLPQNAQDGIDIDTGEISETPGSSVVSHFHVEDDGLLAYHGPTSIYRSSNTPLLVDHSLAVPNPAGSGSARELHTLRVTQDFGINLTSEIITKALRQFFRWQYPHTMFIYREAFLRDHFSEDRNDCQYWSGPLLMAMCALGLVMCPDQQDRAMSDRFSSAAETVLLVSGITQPCITTVQAFLCLALYDIGRGHLSNGWRFSGIAFRMAQDLGIHNDPKYHANAESASTSLEDVEIRRRIYWGCYISDKIISLFLGRPALLSDEDAGVEITERLPDFPEMQDWLPAIGREADSGQEHLKQLVPSFQMQTSLAKITQRVLNELCSPKKLQYPLRRKAQIDALKLELSRWEANLDSSLHWNKWQATNVSIAPSTAALHMLFHSLRIVLSMEACNLSDKPDGTIGSDDVSISSARIIIAIIRKYRSQCSLKYGPFTFVYGIAKALQVVAFSGIPEERAYLLQALDECSSTWTLASNVKRLYLD